MCVSKPKAPVAPPPVELPKAAPKAIDADVKNARNKERKRIASSSGRESTILTGSRGAQGQANTERKVILGA